MHFTVHNNELKKTGGTLVMLGATTTTGTDTGSTPSTGTITLSDSIRNYKFLMVASAYYPSIQAVYGYSIIPVCVYHNLTENIFYPVRKLYGGVSFDAYSRKTDTEIGFESESTYPMSVYGLK